MKVTIKTPQGPLSEATHGAKEFRYALLDADGNTITPFFRCRDYLLDIFWSHYTGKEMSIYGYKSVPSNFALMIKDKKFIIATRIQDRRDSWNNDSELVIHTVPKDVDKHTSELLGMFEQALGFEKNETTVSECGNYVVSKLDEKWSLQPYLVGALVLILRLSKTYDPKEDFISQFDRKAPHTKFLSPSDQSYALSATKVFRNLLKGEIDTSNTYNPLHDSHKVHNNYGIVSYAKEKGLAGAL